MHDVLPTLVPVFLVIASGFAIKRFRLISDALWQPAEQLTYYALFPALLVTTTANADIGALPATAIAAVTIIGSAAVPALLVAARERLGFAGPTFTSVIQGAIRPNTYIGLAAAFALAGKEGLALVALCIVVNVPLVNLLSVLALVAYARPDESRGGIASAALQVARNPLILACLVGGALNFAGVKLPPVLHAYLDILGKASLPIALLAVGAGLDFAAMRSSARAVGIAAGCKLLAMPAIAWGLCVAFGLEGGTRVVVVAFAALPTSASSYVLARQLGGDAPVMAGIITGTTVFAMATMPLALIALR